MDSPLVLKLHHYLLLIVKQINIKDRDSSSLNMQYQHNLIIFQLVGILTPLDEIQYWAEIAVSGKRLEVQERAQNFAEILKPVKDCLTNLSGIPLGKLLFLLT